MEVQTMHMDPRIARIHYRDYHEKVLEHRAKRLADAKKKILDGGRTFRAGRTQKSLIEKEDEQLMESFRAMARGERILNIARVIPAAGLQKEKKLPALAIAGADWKYCYLHDDNGSIVFSRESWVNYSWRSKRYVNGPVVSIPRQHFLVELTNRHWRTQNNLPDVDRAKALVPAIPAHLRPSKLEGYFILWEPEWEAKAPVDPILLKHVSGSIYTVVAQWDLTPLEQSILEGRL